MIKICFFQYNLTLLLCREFMGAPLLGRVRIAFMALNCESLKRPRQSVGARSFLSKGVCSLLTSQWVAKLKTGHSAVCSSFYFKGCPSLIDRSSFFWRYRSSSISRKNTDLLQQDSTPMPLCSNFNYSDNATSSNISYTTGG